MGVKKKSKTNKLARMSEEEKLRYLQHRAAIEEEARRRKEQLISTFMKNKLKHEDAFSRLNSAKINQQWRQTLRQIKNNELHDAAETLRQTFNVAVDTKNKIIETLLADLNDSVVMHNLAVQTHLQFVNKIIAIQEERLEKIHVSYMEQREKKLNEADAWRERGLYTFAEDEESLKLDMHWQELHKKKNCDRLERIVEDFSNHYKYKVLSEMRLKEDENAKKLDQLHRETQNILKDYNKSLNFFISHYKELREADIKHINQHIECSGIINKQEFNLRKLERADESNTHQLKTIADDFSKIKIVTKKEFDETRSRVKEEQKTNEENLKHLSTESGRAIKFLESVLNKVNTIVYLTNSCKKYLTEKELFIPKLLETVEQDDQQDNEDIENITKIFWKNLSEVTVEIDYLSAHHSSFVDENISLKHSLTKYMNTLSKPSSLTSCLFRDSKR